MHWPATLELLTVSVLAPGSVKHPPARMMMMFTPWQWASLPYRKWPAQRRGPTSRWVSSMGGGYQGIQGSRLQSPSMGRTLLLQSTLLGVANNLPSSFASSVPTDTVSTAQPGIRTLGNSSTFSGRMGEMPPMSSQLPFGYGVTKVTRNKIWTSQYVEFFDLLYPSKSADLVMGLRKSMGSTDIIVKFDKAKKIKTIHEWNSAFSIFVAIYTQKFPLEIPHSLKRGEHVRQLERDGANWLYYDEEFRRLHHAENVDWHVFPQERVYAAHHSLKHQISGISGAFSNFCRSVPTHRPNQVMNPRGYTGSSLWTGEPAMHAIIYINVSGAMGFTSVQAVPLLRTSPANNSNSGQAPRTSGPPTQSGCSRPETRSIVPRQRRQVSFLTLCMATCQTHWATYSSASLNWGFHLGHEGFTQSSHRRHYPLPINILRWCKKRSAGN